MKLKRTLSAVMAAAMLVCSAAMPQDAAAADSASLDEAVRMYGDVSGDLTVDVGDAVLLARYLAEDREAVITTVGKNSADVNQSGQPDQGDVVMILEYIARLRKTLDPQPAPQFYSVNLMDGIKADKVKGKQADETFTASQYLLTTNLLKQAVANAAGDNLMISPLSISQALAMTANGADGDTLKEMESVLGDQIGMDDLNAYYYDYVSNLADEEDASLSRANAIWMMDDESRIKVPDSFLKTNADYYGADVFKAPFDDTTLADINNYTNEHTHGMVPKILERFPDNTVMVLLNALAFEAKWQETFDEQATFDSDFTLANGETVSVPMMHGKEYEYLCDDQATGFIKPYEGGSYSFAAILPNEDIPLSDYIENLDAAALQKLIKSRTEQPVAVSIPKFSYSYSQELNDALCEMGMPQAFDDEKADFSRMDQYNGVYIGLVIHKTFIDLNEYGTKAGAATAVVMTEKTCVEPEPKYVSLNRPFLYMILDERTDLPVFIGTVTTLEASETAE